MLTLLRISALELVGRKESTPPGFRVPQAEEIFIEDFDAIPYAAVPELLRRVYLLLPSKGRISFHVLNFGWIVEKWKQDLFVTQELTELLYAQNRRCVWDEPSIARMVLKSGFLKVFTSASVEGLPPYMIYVEAVKYAAS